MKFKTFLFTEGVRASYIDDTINEFLVQDGKPLPVVDCKVATAGKFIYYTIVYRNPEFLQDLQPIPMEVNLVNENGEPLTDAQGIIKG